MKSKNSGSPSAIRLSWLVAAALLLNTSSGKAATVYSYSGRPFTFTSTSCSGVLCDLDSAFTSGVGGSITFDFDTYDTSGTFGFGSGGNIVGATLFFGYSGFSTSIVYPAVRGTFFGEITLNSGAITNWSISAHVDTSIDIFWSISTHLGGDSVSFFFGLGPDYITGTASGPSGTWSGPPPPPPPPVPLPPTITLFATGLGVLGLIGWRRRRNAMTIERSSDEA